MDFDVFSFVELNQGNAHNRKVWRYSMRNKCQIKDVAPILTLMLTKSYNLQQLKESMQELDHLAETHSSGTLICLHPSPAFQKNDSFKVGFPVKEADFISHYHSEFEILPRTKVVSLVFKGEYDQLEPVFKAIEQYMQEEHLLLSTCFPSRILYRRISNLFVKNNPKYYETEVQVPIEI